MCSGLRERLATRGLAKAVIIQAKRQIAEFAVTLDVRNFFVNPDCQELQDIALKFFGLSDVDMADACARWVRENITYKEDEQFDFWQYPSETLARRTGDCEDGAILLANLFRACGWGPGSVFLHVAETPMGFHVFVTLNGKLFDWPYPSFAEIPSDWVEWYRWNARNAYTKPENVQKWGRAV